jgi:hypothetical protein
MLHAKLRQEEVFARRARSEVAEAHAATRRHEPGGGLSRDGSIPAVSSIAGSLRLDVMRWPINSLSRTHRTIMSSSLAPPWVALSTPMTWSKAGAASCRPACRTQSSPAKPRTPCGVVHENERGADNTGDSEARERMHRRRGCETCLDNHPLLTLAEAAATHRRRRWTRSTKLCTRSCASSPERSSTVLRKRSPSASHGWFAASVAWPVQLQGRRESPVLLRRRAPRVRRPERFVVFDSCWSLSVSVDP